MRAARSAVTAGCIGACGDWLMQWQEGASSFQQLDLRRTARIAVYRSAHAPAVEAGWNYFDRRLAGVGGVIGVVARIMCDQVFMAPPSIAAFYLSQGTMEGLPLATSIARTRENFWPTMGVCFPYWFCCHLLTFSIIPPDARIGYTSCCGVVWNAILSGHNHAAAAAEQSAAAAAAGTPSNGSGVCPSVAVGSAPEAGEPPSS